VEGRGGLLIKEFFGTDNLQDGGADREAGERVGEIFRLIELLQGRQNIADGSRREGEKSKELQGLGRSWDG